MWIAAGAVLLEQWPVELYFFYIHKSIYDFCYDVFAKYMFPSKNGFNVNRSKIPICLRRTFPIQTDFQLLCIGTETKYI